MSMSNREIIRYINGLRTARATWVKAATNDDSVEAASHIMSINSKIEFLKISWNWSDETIDFPHSH